MGEFSQHAALLISRRYHVLSDFGALAILLETLLPASHCVLISHLSDLSLDCLQGTFPIHPPAPKPGLLSLQFSYHGDLALPCLVAAACFLAPVSH